jgi:tetratricopeptide (TPR) repeat protein
MRLTILRIYEHVSISYGEEALRLAEELGDETYVAVALLRLSHVRAMNADAAADIATALAGQERAVALLNALPDIERIRPFLPRGTHIADRGRGTLALGLANVGRYAEAEELTRAGSTDFNGYHALATCEAMHGHPDAARAAIKEFLALLPATDARNRASALNNDLVNVVAPYLADDAAELSRAAAAVLGEFARVDAEVRRFPPGLTQIPLLILRGNWEEAWSYLPLVRSIAFTLNSGYISPLVVMLACARGEVEVGWAMVREMFPWGADMEPGALPFRYALSLQETAALLCLHGGNLQQARRWVEARDSWQTWSGATLGQSEAAALWGRYHQQAGAIAKAHKDAERALAHATAPRQPLALLQAQRLLGELDTEAGRYADAEAHLTESLRLAEACEAPYERALTLLAMAELRAAQGQQVEARALLDEVRAICEPLGAKPALARAAALAVRLPPAP